VGPPAWSHDGTRIAFSAGELVAQGGSRDLLVIDVRTGESTTVVSRVDCLQDYYWSAQDDRLVFSAGCGDDWHAEIVDPSSGEVSTVSGAHGVLAVQPAGDLVAYRCEVREPANDLYKNYTGICLGSIYSTAISSPVTATAFPGVELGFGQTAESAVLAYDAIWTPDGSTIAIVGQSCPCLFLLPSSGHGGRIVKDWKHSFFLWASDQVLVTMDCVGPGNVVPCGPYGLTSVRLDTLETYIALEFGCGSAGGEWSPDGSRLAISNAQVGICL
jgi:hypothetical protein